MKYKVISSSTEEVLEEKVNEALSEGWKLQGGIAVATLAQAMTHED